MLESDWPENSSGGAIKLRKPWSTHQFENISKLIVDLNSDMESIKSDQISYQTKQLKSKFEASKSAIHFKYESSDWNWQSYNLSSEMPNPDFVFHNKLPKSGRIIKPIKYLNPKITAGHGNLW